MWGTAAITAVTAQNTLGVQAFDTVTPELVRAQIASVAADLGIDAAKTGMLASAEVVEAVARTVAELGVGPLVVDPVLVSKHGDRLLAADAVDAVRALLVPLATVLTPNLPEAEALVGFPVRDRADMEAAARALLELGAEVVLVKGGHLGAGDGPPTACWRPTADGPVWLEGPRLPGRHTHGTGCVLSAAIAAELARGMEPADACVAAKRFVERAIAAGVALGSGVGRSIPAGPDPCDELGR